MVTASWIDVDEALDKILSYFDVLNAEEKPLLEALGQVLARDITSGIDIPPLDNAAMDGYAVRSQDVAAASEATPVRLRITEEIAAGNVPQRTVDPGCAARIMTGAPIPAGADTVVQFELTDEVRQGGGGTPALESVSILTAVPAGLNIRRAGEDVSRGQPLLPRGTVIRPAEAGVLASLGLTHAPVIRRPVVAVLSTGDELLEPGDPPEPGKIYNSNTTSVAALILRYGGIPRILGIARDQSSDLSAKIRAGLDADFLVTSAGVSLGDYDIVKSVLAEEGEISFWTVRIKPGKPLAFGVLTRPDGHGGVRRIPHLGLPGNPVASMVAFEQFGRPAILKMLGKRVWAKPVLPAILDHDIVNRDGRRYFVRGRVRRAGDLYRVQSTGPQGSGILTSMAQANCFIVVPDGVTEVRAGAVIRVQMVDWTEDYWIEGSVPDRDGAPAVDNVGED